MSRPIFLSYRRSDSASATGRLYDAIRQRFGADTVYMDTSSTAWGEDWPTALENAVAGAGVVIVVIGPDWLRARDDWGRRRIDQAGDWVRREIELAVSSRKTILPLLVGGATMPPPDAFPPEIAELTTRQALRVDEESWGSQVEAVLDRLASRIPERTPRSGAEPRQEPAVADEFRSIASRFYDAPVEDRLAAAEENAGIAGLLELAGAPPTGEGPEAGCRWSRAGGVLLLVGGVGEQVRRADLASIRDGTASVVAGVLRQRSGGGHDSVQVVGVRRRSRARGVTVKVD